MDTIEEIKKLKALLDKGAITDEEFSTLKKGVLSTNEVSETPKRKKVTSSPKTNQVNLSAVKKTSTNYKKPSRKKVAEGISETGNQITVNLLKIGIILSVITGIFFWIRYDRFFALLIVALIGIGASLAIPKLVPKVLVKNLLLGLVNVVLLLLLVFPIGNVESNASTNSSQQGSGIDRSKMNYCSKHSLWYYKDGKCPKCVDESIKESTEKIRKKFNRL